MKKIEITLVDSDLDLDLGNIPKLSYAECSNILEKYPFEDVTFDKVQDALDLLVAYIYNERLASVVIDIEGRNKYLAPVKEMTLEEIEEKLGHKVKIIS